MLKWDSILGTKLQLLSEYRFFQFFEICTSSFGTPIQSCITCEFESNSMKNDYDYIYEIREREKKAELEQHSLIKNINQKDLILLFLMNRIVCEKCL